MLKPMARPNSQSCILTICSGKGGVGKTTIARTIVKMLKKRYRIAVIDGALGLGGISSFYNINPESDISYERFLNSVRPPSEFICRTESIRLIPSFSRGTIEDFGLDREYGRIKDLIEFLRTGSDLIIIDTASGLDLGLYEYMSLSNFVLIIVANDPQSISNGYAISKLASSITPKPTISFFLNMAASGGDFLDFNTKMLLLSRKFLQCELKAIGYMKFDRVFMQSPGVMELGSMLGNDNMENMVEFEKAMEEQLGFIIPNKPMILTTGSGTTAQMTGR